jgi:adenylosuccinate synthase
MNVYLVTRAYLTRHGDGPLWNETKLPYNITESTNPENQFQGKMKYGYLNKEWYDTAILETNNYIKKNLPKNIKNVKTSVAFTCLDQLEGKSIRFSNSDGVLVDRSLKDFDNVSIISEGCMDSDVRFYK